ncbi:hypothetical protein ACIBQX_21020 [Nonomuraea sp. NPDC049714]|uniref:hypothetical protein n=1 Tax=Nonomuraea sp. NPDC049714 TaxID=3364357 RepID=UPI0037AB3900
MRSITSAGSRVGGRSATRRPSRSTTATPSREEDTAFYGKEKKLPDGREVPAGGCYGDALRQVAVGVQKDDEALVQRLKNTAYEQGAGDERVTAATERWSTCMAAAGLSYKTPEDAWQDPRWAAHRNGGPLTPEEKSTASADMACKLQVDYLRVRSEAEIKAQHSVIEAHSAELKALKDDLQVRLSNAAKLLTN